MEPSAEGGVFRWGGWGGVGYVHRPIFKNFQPVREKIPAAGARFEANIDNFPGNAASGVYLTNLKQLVDVICLVCRVILSMSANSQAFTWLAADLYVIIVVSSRDELILLMVWYAIPVPLQGADCCNRNFHCSYFSGKITVTPTLQENFDYLLHAYSRSLIPAPL